MKHNLCVKISYKKYLLANTSFPPPVVLQYTSGGRKSLQPECGIATSNTTRTRRICTMVGRACSPNAGLQQDTMQVTVRGIRVGRACSPNAGLQLTGM